MRSAFASQLVAWEFAEDTSVNKAVDAAMSEAETLGWSDLIDAGFVLSAGARIYGAPLTHIDKSWRTDIVDSGVTPLEGLAMYRARIMLDHGRRV